MGYEWTSIALQQKRVTSGAYRFGGYDLGEAVLIFGLAVLFVYLVLAAQYESWWLPFAVILVVPLGLLGVVAGVNVKTLLSRFVPGLMPMDNNIYTQIGVVLIIALASKNAILIVEFARELRLSGLPIREAAVRAARMRFRPIIMTSFAFILGVAPLVFATGAGAAARQSLGTAVFGGMITGTVLAVFFVPVFFVVIQNLIELRNGPPKLHAGEHLAVAEGVAAHGAPAVEGNGQPTEKREAGGASPTPAT
jgi:HAE1 family hydrophobic/amphiphilic exporter-1